MMGHRKVEQAALFYEFSLDRHVPADHLLRSIDRFVELGELRRELAPFYSTVGRPSIDPELMIRMLIVGYCFGIRSERRLCDEVHLNLAYRWFCRLGLDGDVPDHSTFSKNRLGRFRQSDCCGACSRRSCGAAFQCCSPTVQRSGLHAEARARRCRFRRPRRLQFQEARSGVTWPCRSSAGAAVQNVASNSGHTGASAGVRCRERR
jgi:transposase